MSSSALALAGLYSSVGLTKSGSWPETAGGRGVCARVDCPLSRIAIISSMRKPMPIARRSATRSGVKPPMALGLPSIVSAVLKVV